MYPNPRTIFILALMVLDLSVRAFMQTLSGQVDDLDHASTMSQDEGTSLTTEYNRTIINLIHQHLPEFDNLEDFYRRFHENPELSRQESETLKDTSYVFVITWIPRPDQRRRVWSCRRSRKRRRAKDIATS